jgi:STE24 endopeptidase
VVIAVVVLKPPLSAEMRDLAERVTRLRFVHDIIYWVEYIVLTSILLFPLAYYEGYMREHKHGLATQTFDGSAISSKRSC